MIIVLMGVSGAGKTTIGEQLAERLGLAFIEGDEHHPPENVEKMRNGAPLEDVDRWPWLERLGHAMAEKGRAVVACSALKARYRDALKRWAPEAVFVHLAGPAELIGRRLASRQGHYMPPSLLESQFAALETPSDAIVVDINDAPETIIARICRELGVASLSDAGARS